MRQQLQTDALKQKMLQALDASMDGIALLDANGAYYYLNEVHLTMFDYEREDELLGKTWHVIYGEDEIERINKEIFPLLVQNGKWRGETIGKGKNGRIINQEITLSFTEDGGLICICRDIEQRIKTQKTLQLHTEILRQTSSMTIVTNADREIEWVNDAFTRISGYTLEEVKGKNPGRLLQGKESDPGTINHLKESIRNHQPFKSELLNYKKDGTPYWIEIKGQPLFNNKGIVDHYFAIEEDITERKKTERLLADSMLKMQMAMEGAHAAMWDWDLKNNVVHYSPSWIENIGLSVEEVSNKLEEFTSRLHKDDVDATMQSAMDYLEGRTDKYETEFRIRHKEGHYLHMLDRGQITEWDVSGKPIRLVGIATNITELKEAQQKVMESEERYRRSLEASSAAIWEWDIVHDVVNATNEFYKLFGLELEPNIALSYEVMMPMVHPDDKKNMDQKFRDHFKGLTSSLDIDYRYRRKDTGQFEWYNLKGSVIEWDNQMKPVKAMGVSVSIQQRKEAEKRLQESEERWIHSMEVSGAGFWKVDWSEYRFFFSSQHNRLLGFLENEEVTTDVASWLDRLHPDDKEKFLSDFKNYIKNRSKTFTIEFKVRNKREEYMWIEARIVAEYKDDGVPYVLYGYSFDITEKKTAQFEMERARHLAEASVKAKRRFLANISHEIRTPMHAIVGLGQELLNGNTDPVQRHQLQMINDSAKALLGIINDVLDLSKIEEGKMQIESVRFQFRDLIYGVYDLFSSFAEKKSLKFELQADPALNDFFIGDPVRVRQIFVNLISNAIKFTERGFVNLQCKFITTAEDQYAVEFICEDSGVGMSEEMKDRIFEEFAQEDESFQRRFGGSGLGLSITNELLKLMKGSIKVESTKEKGTIVSVVIPLQKSDLQKSEPAIAKKYEEIPFNLLKGLRVLAAEDNEFNRTLLQYMMQRNEIQFDFAFNGKEAIELFQRNPYDVILMDIQMPEMDGLQATKFIRSELKSSIPVVALTANAVKEELNNYLSEGVTDYLTKPFQEKDLLRKLNKLMTVR